MTRRRWTPEVDDLLCDLYGRYRAEIVAKRLNEAFGTAFTLNAVRIRATRLGIDAPSNQGHLTMSETARLAGIQKSTLAHYLRANRIPTMAGAPYNYLSEAQVAAIVAHYAQPREEAIPTREAARALGVSVRRIHELIEAGRLRAYRHGSHLRIAVASLEEFRRARAKAAAMLRLAARQDQKLG